MRIRVGGGCSLPNKSMVFPHISVSGMDAAQRDERRIFSRYHRLMSLVNYRLWPDMWLRVMIHTVGG